MESSPILDAEEMLAWVELATVVELLPAALNSQLARDHDLTLVDFYVLHFLREADGWQMRLSALAACTSSTLPRMSKLTARLRSNGLVDRTVGAEGDRRAVMITLTQAGKGRLESAAPDHYRAARSLVFDGLTAEQVRQLQEITRVISARLHPHSESPVDRPPSVG